MRNITPTRPVTAVRSRRLIILLSLIMCVLSVGAALRGRPAQSKGDEGRSRNQEQKAGAEGRKRILTLNENAQRELLRRAPMEFTNASAESQVVMTLPMPDGSSTRFRIEES